MQEPRKWSQMGKTRNPSPRLGVSSGKGLWRRKEAITFSGSGGPRDRNPGDCGRWMDRGISKSVV